MIRIFLLIALMISVTPAGKGQDNPPGPVPRWNQWRGPMGTGSSSDAKPPVEWSRDKNLRWKVALPGKGHSSPVLWNDHVFVTTAVPIGPKLPPRMSARPGEHDNLPIDSKYQFAVIAVDRRDGSVLWQKVVREKVPSEAGHYTGSLASASPVTDGEFVFAHFGAQGIYGSSYEKKVLIAINLKDARGDLTNTSHVAWTRSRGTPYVPSMLLCEDALYFLTHYQNVLTRVDGPSGKDEPGVLRLGQLGNIYASPVAANGHVYITDLSGTTMVISHETAPKLVAVNRLDEAISASAAIQNDEIFLRGETHLFCIGATDH